MEKKFKVALLDEMEGLVISSYITLYLLYFVGRTDQL